MWNRRHLLDIESLTAEEIVTVLDTARAFKAVGERAIKKVPALRGKTVVNMFVEPSTRTRISFELAEQRLSADIINFTHWLGATITNYEVIGAGYTPVRAVIDRAANLIPRPVSCRKRQDIPTTARPWAPDARARPRAPVRRAAEEPCGARNTGAPSSTPLA